MKPAGGWGLLWMEFTAEAEKNRNQQHPAMGLPGDTAHRRKSVRLPGVKLSMSNPEMHHKLYSAVDLAQSTLDAPLSFMSVQHLSRSCCSRRQKGSNVSAAFWH